MTFAASTSPKGVPSMAPEILKGETGPSLDIFALGITLFKLLVNERFYQNNNSQFIVNMLGDIVQSEKYHELMFTKLPDSQLSEIIRQMIAFDPHQRYHDSAGNYEMAMSYYKKGLYLSRKTNCFSAEIDIETRIIQLLFVLKRFTEAQKICKKVGTIIHKTFEYTIIFDYNVLAAKLLYVTGDQEKAKGLLKELLEKSTKKYEIAELNYELWCLSNESDYRDQALDIYKDMIKKVPDYFYKKRLQHLQKNQPEDYNPQYKTKKRIGPMPYQHRLVGRRRGMG